MISWIFKELEKMHKDNGWDEAAGNTFGEIAKWLQL